MSVFHSVPGVPRAKMERLGGLRVNQLSKIRLKLQPFY